MLLKRDTLDAIAAGTVDLAFRRWKRPTVKAGGTLNTAVGQLAILAVDEVDPARITAAQARRAGFDGAAALRAELAKRGGAGQLYRIRLERRGEDPRIGLRASVPAGAELDELVGRVRAMDRRSKSGPWAVATLALIGRRPAVRAGDLAVEVGLERDDFKPKVRRLKALGLTESLEVGYRLSPRGEAVLKALG